MGLIIAILSSIALALISAIMFIRANDLGWRPGLVWHIRRIGFILAGFAPWGVIWGDLYTQGAFLTIYEAIFRIGIALVFMTTPYLPPFWRWFFGLESEKEGDKSLDSRGMPKRRASDYQKGS